MPGSSFLEPSPDGAPRAIVVAVTLGGTILAYGTDWTIVNGTTIELVGDACTRLQSEPGIALTAEFPCGAIVGRPTN